MLCLSYHRIHAQILIGNRNVDFIFEGSQDAHFHGKYLVSLINLFTELQEFLQLRWVGLLQVERRNSHTGPRQPTPLLGDEKQRGRG